MSALVTFSKTGQMSIQSDGSDLPQIEALNEAILILDEKRGETCRMALPIFQKVSHAHDYLCKQLRELL